MIKYSISILLILILLCQVSFGQSRKTLERKRKKLIEDISLTSKLLDKTKKNKDVAYDRYVTLQAQIKSREELISTIKEEINHTDQTIARTSEVVYSLKEDIKRLKKDYAEMVRKAYRHKVNNTTLLFIFSATSFNQAISRWLYIRQYDKYRKKQAKLILDTQEILSAKIYTLETRQAKRTSLLEDEEKQYKKLNTELDERNKSLKALRKDEKRLKRELRSQEKKHRKLNDAIEDVIRSEVAIKKRRARNSSSLTSTPSSKASVKLTGDFKSNRGRLPWPVRKGFISKRFGKQAHPTLRKIEIKNNGVDILTDPHADVFAVFDGKVVGTQFIPGYNNMLIIQHGNYYTVYSNLDEVLVKRGDTIKKDERIGKVSVDQKTGKSEVHFEVWHDKVRLNPADWVVRK